MPASNVRTVTVRLAADVTRYVAAVGKDASAATKTLNAEIDAFAKKSPEQFNKAALAATAFGAALSVPLASVIKQTADFDREMSAVASVMDVAGESARQQAADLRSLSTAALDAGADTVFTATQAAQAEEELEKAGVKTADVIGGGLTGALSLASAGNIGLAEAADDAAVAMNVFGLKGAAVGHIADVLASGANKSAADVGSLGKALEQGGQVAAQTGLTLEDTVGTLSAFADNALQGSDAGTSLKTMLQALQNPSKQAQATMDALGLSMYDSAGKFIGITNLAGQLHNKLAGLTEQQRAAALAQIFGSDATRAATVLYKQGKDGLQGYIDAVNQQGAAAKTAGERLNNLYGDVEKLKGSLSTLAISSGSGANSALRLLTQTATSAVDAFGDLPKPISETVILAAGLTGGLTLAATGFAKARQSTGQFMQTLRDMGPTGERAAGALGKVGGVLGKAGLWGAGALAAYEGLRVFGDWVASKHKPIARDIDDLTNSLTKFAQAGEITGELGNAFGKDLRKLAADVKAVEDVSARLSDLGGQLEKTRNAAGYYGYGSRVVNDQINQVKDQNKQQIADIKALDQALANIATNNGPAQARIAFQDLAAAQGLSLSETIAFQKQLPLYSKAASDAGAANTGLAQGFGDAAANAKTLNASLYDAVSAGEKLTDVWKQLHGATLGFDEAQLDAKNSIDELKKTLKENKDAIDGNSKAAIEDRVAVGKMAESAAAAAQAKYEETGSLYEANKVYDDYIGQLRATLKAAGLTDAQINKLLDAYAKMPPLVSTTVEAPGLVEANNTATGYKRIMDRMDGRKVVTDVITHYGTSGSPSARRWGGIDVHNARGGLYEHAQTGLLNQADMYSPVNPGRYVIAEPATGGEAFVPRFGDYDRSTHILDEASRWYGGRFVPQAAMSAMPPPAPVTYNYTTQVTPKFVSMSSAEFAAMRQRDEAMSRVGRPR